MTNTDALLPTLPVLAGSEKQVVWATTIRSKLAPSIELRIAEIESWIEHRAKTEAGRRMDPLIREQEVADWTREIAYLRAFLNHNASALWINHKNYTARDLWMARGVGTARKYGLPE